MIGKCCPSRLSPLSSYPRILFIRQSRLFHSSRHAASSFLTHENTAPRRQAFSIPYLRESVGGSASISPLKLRALGRTRRSLSVMHSAPSYPIFFNNFLMVPVFVRNGSSAVVPWSSRRQSRESGEPGESGYMYKYAD